MARWPRESRTRLFSSADTSSDDSSSDSSRELWASRGANFGKDIGSEGRPASPSTLAVPALAQALRASRARASAALAKASRLQEETGRLRDALKVASREADRADRLENDLTKSELRVRELECDKRRLRRDLEGVQVRMQKTETKARQSLSNLRAVLKGLEEGERARCRRWRTTTRSLRALLESLRRHVQRGLHSAPSFTAYQLIEQLFECLAKQEAEAWLPPRRSETSPPTGTPSSQLEGVGEDNNQDCAVVGSRSPAATSSKNAFSRNGTPPVNGSGEKSTRGSRAGRLEENGAAMAAATAVLAAGMDNKTQRGRASPASPLPGARPGDEEENAAENPLCGEANNDSSKDKRLLLHRAVVEILGRAGNQTGQGGRESYASRPGSSGSSEEFSRHLQGEDSVRLSSQWAYRLAVTKLTAQLKAAKERLRGEKEASRSAGERADQEELRCRQLELEVEGMSCKVAAAETHRRRLEAMLDEAKQGRAALERRQQQSTATHALNAALGIVHRQRGSSGYPSPTFPPSAAAVPPPPPPAPQAPPPPAAVPPVVAPPAAAPFPTTTDASATSARRYHTSGGSEMGELYPAGDRWRGTSTKTDEARREPTAAKAARGAPSPRRSSYAYGPLSPRGSLGDVPARATTRYDALDRGRRAVAATGRVTGTVSGLRGDYRERAGRADERVGVSALKRNSGTEPVVSTTAGVAPGGGALLSNPGRGPRFGGFGRTFGVSGRDAGTVAGSRASSSWGLGPRAVTREDLTRLDEEIANLSKTVDQAAMAQTRQILRNVTDSMDRPGGGRRRD